MDTGFKERCDQLILFTINSKRRGIMALSFQKGHREGHANLA